MGTMKVNELAQTEQSSSIVFVLKKNERVWSCVVYQNWAPFSRETRTYYCKWMSAEIPLGTQIIL